MEKIKQLLTAIEKQELNIENIREFDYFSLFQILNMLSGEKNGVQLYSFIKKSIENIALQNMYGRKITVVFIVSHSSTWCGTYIYEKLMHSEIFEPYIEVVPFFASSDTKIVLEDYIETRDFMLNNGFRVIETWDLEKNKLIHINELPIKQDVCIWCTSWIDGLCKEHSFYSYPLSTLNVYIPYGYFLAENNRGTFVYEQYNKVFHNMCWLIMDENAYSKVMAEKYQFLNGMNHIYTGYPKMDCVFYAKEKTTEWDILDPGHNKKRIIFAPHHSIFDEGTVMFSCFEYIYTYMLALKSKYKNEVCWIFKPHPNLKYKAIQVGIFKNEAEWNDYVNEWNNGVDSIYVNRGDYIPLMEESDAMVLDSISFLAEYMYTEHPLLFLKRKEQAFNEFGEMLIRNHYSIEGTDYEKIEDFIRKVVLSEHDEMKKKRIEFFDKYLNYYTELGADASTNIYNVLYLLTQHKDVE